MTEASGDTGQHAGRRWDVALSFAGAQRDYVGQVAQALKARGYVVTPDPTLPDVRRAYEEREIMEFERHSRLGFVSKAGFMKEVRRLRKIGFKRITLKTGAYPMEELAMAMRWGAEAKIDLLTIDGAPGGTGMSPWNMMNEWGVPTFYLQSLAYEFAEKLRKRKIRVPDLAMAGGFSHEADIYKVLAMGAPHFKAVCMGRGLMIPGMVGKNIGEWLKENKLPKSVSKYGILPREIFVTYEELREKYGAEVKKFPMGAIGLYTFSQKIQVGLQQLMAGSRNFSLEHVGRKDVFALTPEAAEVSKLPYVMNAYRKEAEKILKS